MECIHEKRSFLLDTSAIVLRCCLAALWVLEWIKVEFKQLQKAPICTYTIQIQTNTRTCITEDTIEIEWEASQLLKIDLKPLGDP